jgi:hypothetical protein
MTKWGRFAGWPGRDNIADLHSSVDHYHSIDQQFDQLTSLCKIQLLQQWHRALTKGAQAFGQAHDIQMLLCLRIQLPQLVLQALLRVGNFLSLSLELLPTNNLRQIDLQQAGLLALQLCQGLLQRFALRLKGLGQPLPALSSQQLMRQQCRFSQNSAQILPNHLLIQLMSWDGGLNINGTESSAKRIFHKVATDIAHGNAVSLMGTARRILFVTFSRSEIRARMRAITPKIPVRTGG